MRRSKIEIGTPVIFWKSVNTENGQRSGPVRTEIKSEVYGAGIGFVDLEGLGMQMITNIDAMSPGVLILAKAGGLKGVTRAEIMAKFMRKNENF